MASASSNLPWRSKVLRFGKTGGGRLTWVVFGGRWSVRGPPSRQRPRVHGHRETSVIRRPNGSEQKRKKGGAISRATLVEALELPGSGFPHAREPNAPLRFVVTRPSRQRHQPWCGWSRSATGTSPSQKSARCCRPRRRQQSPGASSYIMSGPTTGCRRRVAVDGPDRGPVPSRFVDSRPCRGSSAGCAVKSDAVVPSPSGRRSRVTLHVHRLRRWP